MAEEASSSYRGTSTAVPSSPLSFKFQAGLAEWPQPKHGSRPGKSKPHASPFRAATNNSFPSFPPSPGPALNGLYPGAGGCSSAGPSAAQAEDLPPRFASAVNISDGASTTPAPAQRRAPHSAAKSGHKSAARRRAHLGTPGGLATPGGSSPFIREGSPMDWSPSVPAPAAPMPAGIADMAAGKDDGLDGLHTDFATSSLSGPGNDQHGGLNEAFGSRFSLGSRMVPQQPPPSAAPQQAQQSAESAPAPASAADDQRPAKTGGAAAQGTCAAPPNASQSGGTQPAAGGGIGSRTLGEDAKSMGRSMSEDDSVDSGLPRGVLHYSPSESTVKGHDEGTSRLKSGFRPGMTLKDFSSAKAWASSSSARAAADSARSGAAPSSTGAPLADGATSAQANGFPSAAERPKEASDPGQPWRQYGSSRTETHNQNGAQQGSGSRAKAGAATSGTPGQRQRPATADLDEYISRQHSTRSEGPMDSAATPGQSASRAETHGMFSGTGRPRSAGQADGAQGQVGANGKPAGASAQQQQAQHAHAETQAGQGQSSTAQANGDAAPFDGPSANCDHGGSLYEKLFPVPEPERPHAGPKSFSFGQEAADAQGAPSAPWNESEQPGSNAKQQKHQGPAAEFSFGAPAESPAAKARARPYRSPKRPAAQAGRPAYERGAPQPFAFGSAPTTDGSQQPFAFGTAPSAGGAKQPIVFGAAASADGLQQPAKASGASLAGDGGTGKEPQPSQGFPAFKIPTSNPFPTGQHSQQYAAGTSACPPSKFPGNTEGRAPLFWDAPSAPTEVPFKFPGSFEFSQGAPQAGSRPGGASQQGPASAAFGTAASAKAPWPGTGAFPAPTQAPYMPQQPRQEPPRFHTAAASHSRGVQHEQPPCAFNVFYKVNGQPSGASGSFAQAPPPFSSDPKAQPQHAETQQQGQAAGQGEHVFVFGEQRRQQGSQDPPSGSAGQREPSPGSARARGYTPGSQNRPPAQKGRFKVRFNVPAQKAAKPQPPAGSTQESHGYTPPRAREAVPIRSDNAFDSPLPGGSSTSVAAAAAAAAAGAAQSSPEDDTERLRQRGNEAFQRGSYSRAADLYKRAIKHQGQLGAGEGMGKLYSNLAACYLQQEQYQRAIEACHAALQAEPSFYKAGIRMATCYMRMGDPAAARAPLEVGGSALLAHVDVAAKLAEVEAQSTRLTAAVAAGEGADSSSAAEAALSQIDALLQPDQAPGSQQLKRLKVQLLLQLSRFEDATNQCRPAKFLFDQETPAWHWWLSVQAAFHSGDLQKAHIHASMSMIPAIDVLSANTPAAALSGDDTGPGIPIGAWKGMTGGEQQGSLDAVHAREMLHSMQSMVALKEAGNRALKASQGQEAVEHYTKALQAGGQAPSIAFAAVLHANRAAARQSLGQHAEAVADCLRATALKPDYAKAHSRLAALLSELRHSSRAIDVLERLQLLMAGGPSGETAEVARRLREARLAAKTGAVDHYKLLGLERSVLPEDVRKAYKKSALQLHPDKALAQCRFSVRLGDAGLELASRSETEQRVRDNADWLFKCIAEAYTVLTDPAARQELNFDLMRQDRRGAASSSARSSPYKPSAASYRRGAGGYDVNNNRGSRHGAAGYGGGYTGRHQRFDDDDDYDDYNYRWNYF